MPTSPLLATRTDTQSAHELRSTIVVARSRLRAVLHARVRALASTGAWAGPHHRRYERDAAALLEAGRVLDRALTDLLTALDAEIAASPR